MCLVKLVILWEWDSIAFGIDLSLSSFISETTVDKESIIGLVEWDVGGIMDNELAIIDKHHVDLFLLNVLVREGVSAESTRHWEGRPVDGSLYSVDTVRIAAKIHNFCPTLA